MASGYANTGKGSGLLTNNVNNTEVDWNKYVDAGVIAKLLTIRDTVLEKRTKIKLFSSHAHRASTNLHHRGKNMIARIWSSVCVKFENQETRSL